MPVFTSFNAFTLPHILNNYYFITSSNQGVMAYLYFQGLEILVVLRPQSQET